MNLTHNKDILQTVFDSASNGIAVMQAIYDDKGSVIDFTVLLFNKYTLNWIGDIEYQGRRYSELFPMVVPTGILDQLIEVSETGITANFERWYDGEGMKHWFRITAVKQDELLVVTTVDISDERRTELALSDALYAADRQRRLYNSITDNTPDLVYVFSLDYKFTYANRALLNMWGKSAEDAIGVGLRENGYEEWHALMHEREIDHVAATKQNVRGTVAFPHAELGSRVYDYILVPVVNAKGEVEAVAGTTRDISEAKHAEEILQQGEARLKMMIEQTPAPTLVLMGDNLVIEQVNARMLAMIGRGEEIIGMPLIEVLPELEGQYVWEQVQNVYKKGIPFDQSEVHVQHNRNGAQEDFYYNLSYRPLIEQERIVGMIQVGIDVTEQVTARKKLEESESRFRNLVRDATSAIVVLTGPEMKVEIANKAYGELIGIAAEDLLGQSLFSLIPETEAYYRPIIEGVFRSGEPYYLYDSPYAITSSGKNIEGFLNVVYQPYRATEGEILGVMVIMQDVTVQVEASRKIQESEEKFRQLADLVPQIIWTGRPDGFVDYYNKRWYEYTAFEAGELGDRSWVPLLHPDDAQMVLDVWYDAVEKGNPYQLEFRIKNGHTGQYRWFLSKAIPIRNKEGTISRWFGTCTDIHEQKTVTANLESVVAERTKELLRSNADLQQFAHVASHDLKEPVRKVKTFVSRLEDHLQGQLDETAIRYIERIHAATDRMFNMVEGVLSYSKINAGLQQPEAVDLNQTLQYIESDLEVILQKSAGKIEYHDLPVIEGAEVLLYQLFYNLINNSLKFTRKGVPPHIRIHSEIIAGNEQSMARISLADNGIGFDPKYAGRIFETFTRLNSKDEYEGTGLGLALCKKIVERHGGSIEASSADGQGACFIITLPLQQSKTEI